MTSKEINRLCIGDKVYWTDPDDDLCSRPVQVLSVEWLGDGVRIIGMDGSDLECCPNELTQMEVDDHEPRL